MSKFLHLPSKAPVAPAILFCQHDDEGLGFLTLLRPSSFLGTAVVRPFLLLHAAIPSEQCFRPRNTHDIAQAILDAHAVRDQNSSLRLGQCNSFAQFAAQNSVLLVQIVVFEGKLLIEELGDPCNERVR